MKLVMTLLVRDEEDILEHNIRFHLNSGVDYIYAIDNGSADATTDILKKYSSLGVLKYRSIQEHSYKQDEWVSSMAKKASEDKADAIIHCDADEFWYASGSNLKGSVFRELQDVLYVPVINYLPPDIHKQLKKNLFENFTYMVANPWPYPSKFDELVSSDLLLYSYPKKIITNSRFTKIGYGNDTVLSDSKIESSISKTIKIHHFPIRNYDHFLRKVINGGSAYQNNPIENPYLGWHWKNWYKIYLSGKLEDEYIKISREKYISKLVGDYVIKKVEVPTRIAHS